MTQYFKLISVISFFVFASHSSEASSPSRWGAPSFSSPYFRCAVGAVSSGAMCFAYQQCSTTPARQQVAINIRELLLSGHGAWSPSQLLLDVSFVWYRAGNPLVRTDLEPHSVEGSSTKPFSGYLRKGR